MKLRALSAAGLATATAAFAFAAAPTATAVEPGPNNIIGGTNATSDPGAVSLSSASTGFFCSGSLITPTKVLTAHHCTAAVSSFQVRAGSLNSGSGGTVHEITSVATQNDVAVVTLATPVPNAKTVTLATAHPAVGSTTQIFGWGRTGPTAPASPVLKTANVRVDSLNATDAYGGRAIRSTGLDGTAWKGDSGGPQFYNGRQVGVCSTGDYNTKTQNYASVVANLDFIKRNAGLS